MPARRIIDRYIVQLGCVRWPVQLHSDRCGYCSVCCSSILPSLPHCIISCVFNSLIATLCALFVSYTPPIHYLYTTPRLWLCFALLWKPSSLLIQYVGSISLNLCPTEAAHYMEWLQALWPVCDIGVDMTWTANSPDAKESESIPRG